MDNILETLDSLFLEIGLEENDEPNKLGKIWKDFMMKYFIFSIKFL